MRKALIIMALLALMGCDPDKSRYEALDNTTLYQADGTAWMTTHNIGRTYNIERAR